MISNISDYLECISENVIAFINNNNVYVYEEEGKVLDFSYFNRSGHSKYYMDAMRVQNESRRSGIATKLVNFCEKLIMENGVKYIGCLVEETNIKSLIPLKSLIMKMKGNLSV